MIDIFIYIESAQDLTVFVQNLLEQMQQRFNQMSSSIIGRIDEMGERLAYLLTRSLTNWFTNLLTHLLIYSPTDSRTYLLPRLHPYALTYWLTHSLTDSHLIYKLGNRIDDLEKSIADLMQQAGIDPPPEEGGKGK